MYTRAKTVRKNFKSLKVQALKIINFEKIK